MEAKRIKTKTVEISMRILKEQYSDMLDCINVDCDLSEYGLLTLKDARGKIPEIEERLVLKYVEEIRQKMHN